MTDIKNPLPFGAHAFVWTPVWDEAGAARAIGGAASLGLDFVEIPLLRLDDFPIEATKALLAEHSIGATTSLGLPKELHMPFDRDGAVRFLGRALELTEALGADALSGALYGHLGRSPASPRRARRSRLARTGCARSPRWPPTGGFASASRR
jgi:D-psicose/D-tagatose/L-ribulose 3-epimerase